MIHTKLLKAGLGAGLLLVMSASLAFATTANNVTVTVTADTGTIALESSCALYPAVTFQDTGDTVTKIAHGLANGDPVQFATIVTTTGISIDTTYYVFGKTDDTFQLSATLLTPSAIALTTDGTGTINNCLTAFDIANTAPLTRGDSNVALVNADSYTQSLHYITDYTGDVVSVTAGGGSAAELIGTSAGITLHVIAAVPSAALYGENTGTESTQDLRSTAKTSLITAISGAEARVNATSALTFTADAGLQADTGANAFTLTYSISAH